MCAINPLPPDFKSPVAQISVVTDLTILNIKAPQRIPNPCTINVPCDITEPDLRNDIIPPIAQQHRAYGAAEGGLFFHIQSQADTTFLPKYDGADEMTTTLQHLRMSDLLTHDDEGVDENGPNDIDYVCYLVKLTTTSLLQVQ